VTFKQVENPRPLGEGSPNGDLPRAIGSKCSPCGLPCVKMLFVANFIDQGHWTCEPSCRVFNRDLAACLNFILILKALRSQGHRPQRFLHGLKRKESQFMKIYSSIKHSVFLFTDLQYALQNIDSFLLIWMFSWLFTLLGSTDLHAIVTVW